MNELVPAKRIADWRLLHSEGVLDRVAGVLTRTALLICASWPVFLDYYSAVVWLLEPATSGPAVLFSKTSFTT